MNAGVQTRNVWCAKRRDSSEVSRDLCNDALEPLSSQQCAPEPCAPQWTTGEWGPCSQSCGTGGTQTRQVRITSNKATFIHTLPTLTAIRIRLKLLRTVIKEVVVSRVELN